MAAGEANALLDAYARNQTYTNTAFWVKLHTADPGASGATAAAGETTRKQATMSAATGGTITNSAALDWVSVSTTETISHISYWTASTAGTFKGSDDLATPRALTAGDNFSIAIGDLDLALTPVAS